MKNLTLSLLSVTAFCSALALPALAATNTSAAPPRFHGGHGMERGLPGNEMKANLHRLDTNKDGKISFDELLAPRLARIDKLFTRLDKNGDGLISQDELPSSKPSAAGSRRHRGNPSRPAVDRVALSACVQQTNPSFQLPDAADREDMAGYFAKADSNGDGKLSLAELTAAVTTSLQTRFNHMDVNGDGFITKADIQANAAERIAVAKAVRACMQAQTKG